MATQRKPRRRIRVVFQRSSIVTKSIVLATLAITTAALLTLTISIRNARAQEEADREKAAALERQNQELEQIIENTGSVEGIKDVAEKELGYVDGDAVIFEQAPTSTP